MDWINNSFSENIDKILKNYTDINEKDKKNIKAQFAGIENNSDKYKWLEILQKDNNNNSSTKKYYHDIYNQILDYKEYFDNNCTTVKKLEIGELYTKQQISTLAGSGDIMSGIITSNYGNKKDTFITINLEKDYSYKSIGNKYSNVSTRNVYNKETKELKYYLYTKDNAKDYQVLEFSKNKNILHNSFGNENNSGYIYAFVNSTKNNLKYINSSKLNNLYKKGYIYIGKYIFKDISNRAPYYFTLENADKVIDEKTIEQSKINSQIKSIDIYEDALKEETILSNEEKRALVKIRTNQGFFREKLLKKFNYKCPLTGFENEAALIASHIKPWSKCKNQIEKLDQDNGILLNSLADKLFDKGLITFDDDGRIIYSKQMSNNDILIFEKQLKNQECFLKMFITSKMIKYLKFHRAKIFLC